MLATAKDLKPGDQFKWRPRQREFRTVNKVVPVPEKCPEHHKFGLIIVLSDCRTLVLQPQEEIILKGTEVCTPSTK